MLLGQKWARDAGSLGRIPGKSGFIPQVFVTVSQSHRKKGGVGYFGACLAVGAGCGGVFGASHGSIVHEVGLIICKATGDGAGFLGAAYQDVERDDAMGVAAR